MGKMWNSSTSNEEARWVTRVIPAGSVIKIDGIPVNLSSDTKVEVLEGNDRLIRGLQEVGEQPAFTRYQVEAIKQIAESAIYRMISRALGEKNV